MNIQSPKLKPALLALAMVIGLGAFDGLRAEDRALVTRLVGVARVQKGGQGEFQNLKLRAIIQSKDKIQTGPQSNLVIIYQGKEIRLGPKTEVTLENLNSKKEPLQVKLKKGFTWIDVKKLNNQGVEVVSPTAVASVRGTKFSVSHDDHGSATCVCEGTVATRHVDEDNFEDVSKGYSNDFDEDGKVQTNDFTKLFRGLKVDNKFQSVIDKDPKMQDCTMCHKMTDLATDNSPDPTSY